MDALKKLFIALTGLMLLTLGFDQMAYATELQKGISNEDPIVITEESDITSDVNTKDSETNKETADTALLHTDDNLDTDNSELVDIKDNDSIEDSEEVIDLDKYEIYIDEQGQVYYIEKEPEELEIIDSDEEVEEKEEKEEQEEKKEKKEKAKKNSPYSEKDVRLLASLVYAEAGNQSYKGMLAVANVVLNRVKSNIYSHVNTIEEVIYDKKWSVQFTVTIKNKKTGKSLLDKALEYYDTGEFKGSNPEAEKKAMNRAIKAAKAALSGENNIGNYLCFRVNRNTSSIKKKYEYTIIGDHIFYRTK